MDAEELNSFKREFVSETTRRLLCVFAAGEAQCPLPYLEPVAWEEVFQAVCRNGLIALTYHYLKQRQDQSYPPPPFKAWVQKTYRINAINMALLYRQVHQTLQALNETGVDYLVLKGPAVAHLVYSDPHLRPFRDLDLMVRERDWGAIHQQLLVLGFHPEQDLPDPPPKLNPQSVVYELKYSHPESKLLIEVHYDDLLNAGLAAREVEGFWKRAVPVEVEGVRLKTLSLEDQLLHLCMHAHYHGYVRLNWFSDIAFIVRNQATRLDWSCLLETAQREEAQVGVYYSLYFLERLLAVSVPAEVMRALRPDRFRRWWHEYYMPEAEILSLQPMWRADFSFYFRPLFKRLLPDLLVMGRRRDKLAYLLRLLLPPQAWLRHYYKLNQNQPLAVHYLLHPLKLLYHYLDETVALFRSRKPGHQIQP
jgi:hypothetical protein